jgi:hypothetical protein
MWKELVAIYFKVVTEHLSGKAEENYEISQYVDLGVRSDYSYYRDPGKNKFRICLSLFNSKTVIILSKCKSKVVPVL